MLVRHLGLKDFRNYEIAEVDLDRGANVFSGSNGQGKTNLVEALGYLSTLGSHRVATDAAMIRNGEDAAIIRARIEHESRTISLEVQLNRASANRAQANGAMIRPKELPRYFSSVLFAPEDIALVRGEPSGRRRFLDEVLVLRSPRLSGVMADYDRVLKQRNTLLKSARNSGLSSSQLGTLDVWDERLIGFGAELIHARSTLVAELSPEVAVAYETVAGVGQSATLSQNLSILSHSADDEVIDDSALRDSAISIDEAIDAFTRSLSGLRRTELSRGQTLVGPHRDDLIVLLNGTPARGYASHGESWSLALALRLGSATLLRRESISGDPVLILDDVFAELDEARRGRLAGAVHDFEQVLVTAAVIDDVPRELAGTTVTIANGRIVGRENAVSGD